MNRPEGDDAPASDPLSADAAGDAASTVSIRLRNRRAMVIGIVIAASIATGGALALTVGLYPAWRSLVAVSPLSEPASRVLVWRDAQGVLRKAAVDPVKYDELAAEQGRILNAARTDTRAAAKTRIEADVAAVFSEIEDRIPHYGEWYYRYTTKYVLMTHAAIGLWHDSWDRPGDKPFTAAEVIQLIQDHLAAYLEEQYAAGVLHPQDTEIKLQNDYERDLAALHEEWRTIFANENRRFAEYLDTQQSTIVPAAEIAGIDGQKLDWDFRSSDVVRKARVTVRKFRRGLLTIAISRPGRYIVPGAPAPEPEKDPGEDTDEISHVIGNLFTAVIDPLSAQASALLAGTVAGGFAGAMTGGAMPIVPGAVTGIALSAPLVGAAIGAAITISTDIASTRLEEHMTRGAFEQNLRDTLAKTQKEITDNLVAALYEHADSQFVEGSGHLGAPAEKKPE
jgi:hypothetical protein